MGRFLNLKRPWPTARIVKQRTALLVGLIGCSQLVLDAVNSLLPSSLMMNIRLVVAGCVALGLFQIETNKGKPRGR